MDFRGDTLTETGAILHVQAESGPGFLERFYRKALLHELALRGLSAETEKEVVVRSNGPKGQEVGRHRLDLLVEESVIVELKTVESLALSGEAISTISSIPSSPSLHQK